jgi:membrane protein DedA with SNARE-associated domain
VISDILIKLTFWMGRLGYLGVFISAVGVLPAELVITMVAATRPDQIIQIAIVASLGEVVGALWTYAIGYYFKDKDVLGFLNGKGKWMNISEDAFNKSNRYIKKHGFLYIVLTRFTPGLRVAVLLVAGYLKYNIPAACVAVFVGTFIYALGFAYLGAEIGFNWEQIKRIMDMINGGLTILTLSIIGYLVYKNKEKLLQLFRKEISK